MENNSASEFRINRGTLGFVAFSAGIQLLLFVLLYWFFSPEGISEAEEGLFYFTFFSAGPVLSIVGFHALSKIESAETFCPRQIPLRAALIAIPISIVLFGMLHAHKLVYFTYAVPPPSIPLSNIRFLIGVIFFGLIAAMLALNLSGTMHKWGGPQKLGAKIPGPLRFIGIALVLSLFDVYMMIDSASFAPYVAPAFLVANGQRPMIDAFSQYGPNFLIFAAAFRVLPQSFFTVAAIVAALNVVMYLTFVGIAVNIARNKSVTFVIAVCIVLFIHSAHLYNITYTPSVFAMRFLPPLLLIYTLSSLRTNKLFSPLSIFALGLCSVWALESFVFGTFAYSAFVLLRCIGERRTALQYLGALTTIFVGIAVVHACVWGGYIVLFGRPPDYITYLQLVLFHVEGGAYWNLPIEPGVMMWALFGFAYTATLAFASHISLHPHNRSDGSVQTSAIMGAVSVLGILMFYYYIGRSATPILMFVSLPLFLIFIRVADWAIGSVLNKESLSRDDEAMAKSTLVIVLIAFPLMGGVFVDKFFQPYSQHLSNSSALRSVLSGKNKRVHLGERLATWRAAVPSGTYPNNEAGGSLTYTHPENLAAFELIRKFDQGSSKILLFIADPVPVIFYTPPSRRHAITYPAHTAGLAYPAVDGLSSNLTDRTFTALKNVSKDDVVVIGSLQRTKLDEKVLDYLRGVWALCKIDVRAKVIAYRLQPKSDRACTP